MKEEYNKLVMNCWKEIVVKTDFRRVTQLMIENDPDLKKLLEDVPWPGEEHFRHYNRLILFRFVRETTPDSYLQKLSDGLKRGGYDELAEKVLGRKVQQQQQQPARPTQPANPGPSEPRVSMIRHKTSCFKVPDEPTIVSGPHYQEPFRIDVAHSTKFYDHGPYCYRIRSKNRGRVLVINNISFDPPHEDRLGAEVDECNLKLLFTRIGLEVDMYRNLTAREMKLQADRFAKMDDGDNPDMCFVIIMSHGERRHNETVIVGSDGDVISEEAIKMSFSNQNCVQFRNKPKVFIFHVCRGGKFDEHAFLKRTQNDSARTKGPDRIEDRRLYSDMLICHPSLEGYQAHRDVHNGCWYVELICQVFMEHAHNTDIEFLLKMVDRGLENRMSESGTQQTSSYMNIGFKHCYLHPGVYEEDGELKKFDVTI